MRQIKLNFRVAAPLLLRPFLLGWKHYLAGIILMKKSLPGTGERKLKLRLREKVRDFAFFLVFKGNKAYWITRDSWKSRNQFRRIDVQGTSAEQKRSLPQNFEYCKSLSIFLNLKAGFRNLELSLFSLFKAKFIECKVNPFSTNVPLLYPLKTENLQFSDVFRWYRNGILVENRLSLLKD